MIPVGFLMADATDTVAKAFPNTKFAIIDSRRHGEKGKPKNIEGLLFQEQQAGYLAGYLAGLYAKAHSYKTISSVGGQKIPPVDHYIAGYQAGAKAADPGIQTLNGYSQDFVDQDKCKEIALNQIAQGSKVVFQVAGACGLGALDGGPGEGRQGIGVDADQALPRARYILTSAAEEGRRGGVQRDQGRAGRHVPRRQRRHQRRSPTAASATARSRTAGRSSRPRSRRSTKRSSPARSRTSRTRSHRSAPMRRSPPPLELSS